MRLRRAAVVVAVAAGTALAVTGTTNASPENECGETGTYTETRSWTEADCDFRFARSDSEDHHKDWEHKDKDHHKDWEHKDKHHDKDKHHGKDKRHHHKDKHHKKQVHKKPHGGVETGDGSMAALL